MTRIASLIATILIVFFQSKAFAGPSDSLGLTVVNWNLEFFGDPDYSGSGKEVSSIALIMNELDADVYALSEVVDIDSLYLLQSMLNSPYNFVVSNFGSFADNPQSSEYPSAQKLALLYKASTVEVDQAQPLMYHSGSAHANWSSGRFPYRVQAKLICTGQAIAAVDFIVLHAKAGADPNSCDRRVNGVRELKDSLDAYFSAKYLIILGDFNDDLDTSICGSLSKSSYSRISDDSLDNNSYHALTLGLSKEGKNTIYGYSSFLDHVVVSNEVVGSYVKKSATVCDSLVKALVPDYHGLVSDNYPVLTRYKFACQPLATVSPPLSKEEHTVFPNPADNQISLPNTHQDIIRITAVSSLGVLYTFAALKSPLSIDVRHLLPGYYTLSVTTTTGIFHYPIIIRH